MSAAAAPAYTLRVDQVDRAVMVDVLGSTIQTYAMLVNAGITYVAPRLALVTRLAEQLAEQDGSLAEAQPMLDRCRELLAAWGDR